MQVHTTDDLVVSKQLMAHLRLEAVQCPQLAFRAACICCVEGDSLLCWHCLRLRITVE